MMVMTNPVDKKWIERKMAEAGIRSKAELGRRIGIEERSLMSLIFAGKRSLREDAMLKMANELRVTMRELAHKLGGRPLEIVKAIDETDKATLDVRGTIDDRFTAFFYPPGRVERVRVDIAAGVGAFALRYDTSGTAADMFDGSITVILEKRDVEPAAMLERNNLVWLVDGKVLLRRVTKGQLPDRYNLSAANVSPLYDVEIIAFAPVQALLLTEKK